MDVERRGRDGLEYALSLRAALCGTASTAAGHTGILVACAIRRSVSGSARKGAKWLDELKIVRLRTPVDANDSRASR